MRAVERWQSQHRECTHQPLNITIPRGCRKSMPASGAFLMPAASTTRSVSGLLVSDTPLLCRSRCQTVLVANGLQASHRVWLLHIQISAFDVRDYGKSGLFEQSFSSARQHTRYLTTSFSILLRMITASLCFASVFFYESDFVEIDSDIRARRCQHRWMTRKENVSE